MDYYMSHPDDVPGNSSDPCAVQDYLVKGAWCPASNFTWPDDVGEAVDNKSEDGTLNFLVYRAATLNDPYGKILENDNAADRAGVLSYLHTEVIPDDMRTKEEKDAHTRKYNIDSIMIFNVTVKNNWNPPGQPLTGFVSFEHGECNTPGCEQNYKDKGYTVGYQVQSSNPRAKYGSHSYWYSFPKGGLCDKPNGTKTCTYSYFLEGRVNIDTMVNLDRLGYKDFKDFSTAGKTEYTRDRNQPCTTLSSINFWPNPCNESEGKMRMQRLMGTPHEKVNEKGEFVAPLTTTRSCTEDEGGNTMPIGQIIGIAAGSVVALAVGGFVYMNYCRSKRNPEKEPLVQKETGDTAA
jgi:hypothetical protein